MVRVKPKTSPLA